MFLFDTFSEKVAVLAIYFKRIRSSHYSPVPALYVEAMRNSTVYAKRVDICYREEHAGEEAECNEDVNVWREGGHGAENARRRQAAEQNHAPATAKRNKKNSVQSGMRLSRDNKPIRQRR